MRLEETAYKKTSQTSSLKERLWTRASKVEKKKYAFTCVSHVATVYTGHCIVKIEVGVGSVGLNSTKESIQEINIIKLPLENMAKRILFFEGTQPSKKELASAVRLEELLWRARQAKHSLLRCAARQAKHYRKVVFLPNKTLFKTPNNSELCS